MILDAMNKDDPSPFVEESGEEYSVDGVKGVRYLKGTPDEGGIVLIDNSGNQDSDGTGEDVDGAEETANNATDAEAIATTEAPFAKSSVVSSMR